MKPKVIRSVDLGKYSKVQVIDEIDMWLESLFEIKHPELLYSSDFNKLQKEWISALYDKAGGKEKYGSWILLSERGGEILLHTVPQDDYFDLLTNRNKVVYEKKELEIVRGSKVCIFGQSIGGNVALLLAHAGYGSVALTDFDTLDPTNLNRVFYGSSFDVGRPKVEVVAESMWKVNPYINIDIYEKGINIKNLDEFVEGCSVIIELIDDFKMKIAIRKKARELGVPVLMNTNLGRWMLADVERYDLDPETPLFNGLVDEKVLNDIEAGKMSPQDINRYARELVGVKNVDPRALQSLPQIGKETGLVGRPQIISSVASSAGAAAFMIAWSLGCFKDFGELKSGRALVKGNEIYTI